MAASIRNMFDGIARRYDFLNHLLSAGRDRAWRRKAAGALRGRGCRSVLDLCGGTGDFWKSWADEAPADGSGLGVVADFSLPMLRVAQKKFAAGKAGPRPALVVMDALNPPFKAGSFDAVLCAFGMRNLDSLDRGVDEVRRLLRPSGTFVTLEFFRPDNAWTRVFYGLLAPLGIPLLGGLFSSRNRSFSGRRRAYAYLVDSIRGFCSVTEYRLGFLGRGFREVAVVPCDFGISHIVTAVRKD